MLGTVLQDYGTSTGSAAGAGIGLLLYFAFIVVTIAVYFVAAWKIWEKMGDPGWMGLVPFLNVYRVFQRTRPNEAVMYTIGSIIPCVNIVVGVIFILDIAKLFGKEIGYAVGLIIPCVSWVFWLMLAFGDARYVGPPAPELGGSTPPAGPPATGGYGAPPPPPAPPA